MANIAPADLAKEFRSMLMKVSQQLSEDEMTRLAYEEGFTLELPPGSTGLQDMRVHFLHKLEAKGLFSTMKPDGFAALMKRLSRDDLLAEVIKYKQHPLFVKTSKKPVKWRKPKALEKRGSEHMVVTSGNTGQESLRDMYAVAMTHASSLLSVLEELRELMQQPLPQEKVAELTPQVKDAIIMLSKDKQTVGAICESLRKAVAESPSQGGTKSLGATHSPQRLSLASTPPRTHKKLPMTPPTNTKRPLTQSLSVGSNFKPNSKLSVKSHEAEGEYSDIVSMSSLAKAYETYDQVPVRRNALEANYAYTRRPLRTRAAPPNESESYVNVPPREDSSSENAAYVNVPDSPSRVEEVSYDEIVDKAEVDEDNYGTVRHDSSRAGRAHSDSGTGTGSGEAEHWDWLPHTSTTSRAELVCSDDELVRNPMYDTQPPKPTRGRTQPPKPTRGHTQPPQPTGGYTQPPQPTGGYTQPPQPTGGCTQPPQPTGGQGKYYMKLLPRQGPEGEESIYTDTVS